jgi:RsiW-degrading membrane proteinase PrsW (M82 family)
MSKIEQGKVTIPLHRPGLKEKLFFFSSGVIVSIPLAAFFEGLASSPTSSIPQPYASILFFAILAPIIEEFGKAYPLFYRHGETKKSVMTLGCLVGLGFGIIEFLEYVLIYGVPVILLRLPGIFFHPASTSIVAYGIANKKSSLFYLVAVALHFSYNIAALYDSTLVLILIIFWLTLFLFYYLYRKTPDAFIPY